MKRGASRGAPAAADPGQRQSTAQRLASAAGIVAAVLTGTALDDALAQAPAVAAPDRAALQALAFGTVRWHLRIAHWLDALLERPGQVRGPLLRALLEVALHQLGFSSHPAHAVVNEAVEAARLIGEARAAGLVNALLRRFLRERAAIEAQAIAHAEARHAHPAWLIAALGSDWPADAERVLAANNEPAPLWLRVNARRTSVGDYLTTLRQHDIEARADERLPDAIVLAKPLDVARLPGFAAGLVSVQDGAAQLAAPLLAAAQGMRVLDACAAPGGKTCHILERTPGVAELVALERSRERLQLVEDNLQRLGLKAQLVCGDAAHPEEWWDGAVFQRILLDAPCSATGVIRRHPDIKLLRRAADIVSLSGEQAAMLRALWPLLEPGGRLVYCTCSVLRAENHAVIAAFLADEPSAVSAALPHELDVVGTRAADATGLQILPGAAGMDGFYYACLERRRA
ncbi:MAG TPA: 16S rRNA (cytosine(967)-C(5))-methyltransferase RsmB [Steroidobacteraceae bacterium]|nr:16S rRNA (cytosine(967)-C(5))-methyltransferase RsmB [Steroidobacteraceae bacterium]